MKKFVLTMAVVLAGAMSMAAQKPQQNRFAAFRGVGPVEQISESVSALPEDAQTFINELFPATTVASVTRNVADNDYKVKMSDGVEITFNNQGVWKEVEAPDNAMLPSSTLKKLVPENEVIQTLSGSEVANGGVVNFVEEIVSVPGVGYFVEYEVSPVVKGKVALDKSGNVMSRSDVKAAFAKAAADNSKACKSGKIDKRGYKAVKHNVRHGKSGRNNQGRGKM